jgi:O-antigen ligase
MAEQAAPGVTGPDTAPTRESSVRSITSSTGVWFAPHDATPVAIVFLLLINLIPPLLVVPGLGAAGRPAALLGLGMLAWWTVSRFQPQQPAPRSAAIPWVMFAFLMASVASMIAGLDRGLPGLEARSMDRNLLLTLSWLGLVLVLTFGLDGRDAVERVLSWAVLLGAFGALVGLAQFAIDFDLTEKIQIPGLVANREAGDIATRGQVGYARVRGFARHPIEYGVVLATLLPIAIHLSTSPLRHRRILRPAAVLIAISIPLSISRSAILALVIGMAVYSIGWTWRQRWTAAAVTFVGAIAFQAVTPGLLGTIRSLFSRVGSDNSITGRTEDYGAASQFISQRPWFGRGPGTFLVETYRVLDNEYLGTLIEGGVVGLGALVALLLVAGGTALQLSAHEPDPAVRSLNRALGATIAIAIVVFATFDALAFPIYSGVLFLVIGCLGALHRARIIATATTTTTTTTTDPSAEGVTAP